MLDVFGPDIWIADGPETQTAGFPYPTRMALIRLADGGLFVWSPVALTPDLRAALATLGPVRHIVAPNSLHDLWLADWAREFPDAAVWGPPALRAKRRDIAFDGVLDDAPDPAWADRIDQAVMRGNLITTEIVFFHRQSRTVLFTDLIQQHDPARFSGWRAVVARLDLMTAPEPAVPRKFRVAFLDRAAARDSVRRVLAWPANNVLMAHGTPVRGQGAAFLRRAFAWLTG